MLLYCVHSVVYALPGPVLSWKSGVLYRLMLCCDMLSLHTLLLLSRMAPFLLSYVLKVLLSVYHGYTLAVIHVHCSVYTKKGKMILHVK